MKNRINVINGESTLDPCIMNVTVDICEFANINLNQSRVEILRM